MADIKLSPLMRDMLDHEEGDAAEALRLALRRCTTMQVLTKW